MSFLKRLFNKKEASNRVTRSKNKEIHISRIESYTEGNKYAIFHFPGYENDLFSIEIFEDEFSDKKELRPYEIHSYRMDKVLLFADRLTMFNIGLLFKNDKIYITLAAYQKEIKFNIDDKLSILFKDEEILEITIKTKGYKVDKDSDGVIVETIEEISDNILSKLSLTGIKKWKYKDVKNDKDYSNYLNLEKERNILEMSKMMKIGIEKL